MACITKKRGRLVIDFYDQHGRRRLKTLPEGTRKKDARKMLHETLKQVERGTYLPDKKIPTFRKVAHEWLEYKRMNLREHPYDGYDETCEEQPQALFRGNEDHANELQFHHEICRP